MPGDREVHDVPSSVDDDRVLIGDLDAGLGRDVREEGLEQALAALIAERPRAEHTSQHAETPPTGTAQVVDQAPQRGHREQTGSIAGEVARAA